MPPEQTPEAGIVDAALPLLRAHGDDVTTKQIAEAAGHCRGHPVPGVRGQGSAHHGRAVQQVFDPEPTLQEMDRIDLSRHPFGNGCGAPSRSSPFAWSTVWEMMSALQDDGSARYEPPPESKRCPAHQFNDLLPDALSRLLEPDRDQFRVEPAQVARLLRLVTFACTHPRFTDGDPLKPDEVVDLLLDGLRAHTPT